MTVVLNGGVFSNYPEYAEAVKKKSPADTTFAESGMPPVYGCAVEALYSAGVAADEKFRETFAASLRKQTGG